MPKYSEEEGFDILQNEVTDWHQHQDDEGAENDAEAQRGCHRNQELRLEAFFEKQGGKAGECGQ